MHMLGVLRCRDGDLPGGIAILLRALALRPGHDEGVFNLGKALTVSGDRLGAARQFRRVLVLAPATEDGHANLAYLRAVGQEERAAITAFRRSLAIAPQRLDVRMSLAAALRNLRRFGAAAIEVERVLDAVPDRVDAREKLADALVSLRKIGQARRHGRCALVLDPASSSALFSLANVASLGNDAALSVVGYRRVLAVDPGHIHSHSNLIFDLDFSLQATLAEQQAERRRWYRRHGRHLAPEKAVHALDRRAERPLRVGYVSADFRHHSASHAFGPVVLNHDPAAVEPFLYSNHPEEDDRTALFRSAARAWRPIHTLTDEAAAALIRQDRIDILVDLSGHSDGNRLLVFARKPAPIQATGWGHATGTGLETVDWFLADPALVPAEDRTLFAERIFDLPCFLAYTGPDHAPQPVLPSADRGFVTFGCLNRLSKLSRPTLDLWSELLRRMPGARLLLKDGALSDPRQRERILSELTSRGIEAGRVVLRGRTSHAEQLATYGEIDVALDPFPQNGGVSTFEALWMGVPVVARRGGTVPARAAAAILDSLGLSAWVAATDADYLAIAGRLAGDRESLERVRSELRPRLAASIPCDPVRYCRVVEAVYRTMWRRHLGLAA
jgi:protein O-GlcNAc transferase